MSDGFIWCIIDRSDQEMPPIQMYLCEMHRKILAAMPAKPIPLQRSTNIPGECRICTHIAQLVTEKLRGEPSYESL